MNLYLLTQDVNTCYDTYDSMVVMANSEDEARHMVPETGIDIDYIWCKPEFVKVEHIGMALSTIQEPKVIIASFNAG